MTYRTREPFSVSLLDGAIALCITTAGMCGLSTFSYALRHFRTFTFRAEDCVAALVFLFAWQYCFYILKLYDKSATVQSRLMSAFKGVLLLIVPVFLYFSKIRRNHYTLASVLGTFLALYLYEIARLLVSSYFLDRMAARDSRRAIIIGSGRRASKAWRSIRTRYHSSIHLLGFIDDRDVSEMPPELACHYLGGLDQLGDVMLSNVVDMILIAMPIQSCYPLMQRAVHIAESAGVQVMYLDDIYLTRTPKDPNQSIFRDLAPEQDRYLLCLAAKRIFDGITASIISLLLMPLLLLIALGVRLTSEGPVLFQQERCGHRRRRFKMMKFRSMVHNAEHLLPHLEHANEAVGPIFKMKDDPRVTKFGKFLRSTSLDELPQLWNVIRGDMSLVGPRPMSVRDVSLFSQAALMRRFSVKPGMTGLWQVSGRSNVSFDEWMVMDNSYIDSWSLSLDFKILTRTVGAVLRRSGAM